MAKRWKRKAPDLDKAAADLARMLQIKRRLIEVASLTGDTTLVLGMLDEFAKYLQLVREELEFVMRMGACTDMSPEDAKTRVHLLRMLGDSLQAEESSTH